VALARALKASEKSRFAALLGDTRRSAPTRLEIMRAAVERIPEAAPESRAILMDLAKDTRTMRVRYLVLAPLAQLARAGDAIAAERISEALAHDPSWPVRARAAELAGGLSSVQPVLALAAQDAEPRVREAALASLAAAPSRTAVSVAMTALAHDDWSFVRTRAAELLAKAPAGADVDDALGAALGDGSVSVRTAVVTALARRQAMSWRKAVRDRLTDGGEAADVRTAAASALGAMCDMQSVDQLTAVARALGAPGVDRAAQETALAAVSGLAALQPGDLRQRLSPLLAPSSPPFVRAIAERALAGRSRCH
jgi:HEAT repeat protein